LTAPDELAFGIAPEWMVIVDDVEPGAHGDILGVLVTTGPVTATSPGLPPTLRESAPVLWVEYIAIAPNLRPNCPPTDRRSARLKGIGTRLMQHAIARSQRLGCGGRIGLHAEGDGARTSYTGWGMTEQPPAPHPTGGSYPVFLGSDAWASDFLVGSAPKETTHVERKEPG